MFCKSTQKNAQYPYFAKVSRDEYTKRSLTGLIDKYFDNSYLNAVSALLSIPKERVNPCSRTDILRHRQEAHLQFRRLQWHGPPHGC